MPEKTHRVIIEKDVSCNLRDGTVLYSDVYRPDMEGKFPVILHRTPYDKDNISSGFGAQIHPVHAARRGYVVVVQDVRGRFTSQGKFRIFEQEIEDGYDAVEWVAMLPYSNGRVGMFGGSYTGVTQILATVSHPPHLVAISPRQTGSNYYDGWTYQGGAFALGFNFLWSASLAFDEVARTSLSGDEKRKIEEELAESIDNLDRTFSQLPIKDVEALRKYGLASYFYEWLDHPEYDKFWEKINAERHYQTVDVASLHIGGWYDIFLKGTIQNYVGMRKWSATERARKGQKLIIGPWIHGPDFGSLIGEWNSGYLSQGRVMGIEALQLRWFDYWLKGLENGVMDEPPVKIFVMGENRWRDESEWPLKRTNYTNYYFHSGGHANTLHGDGVLSPDIPKEEPEDSYIYDPLDPVPTRGGGATGAYPPALKEGVFDQRPVEERDDVLVYTTRALDRDTEVTGPVKVHLYASSSEQDTDFTAKLVDLHQDGYAWNLCDGILRARYREALKEDTDSPSGFQRLSLIQPGVIYKFVIDLIATSNLFRKGHRIRVEISSSNYPRFDRNLNTGGISALDSEVRKAVQTIYHSSLYPSNIVLPIIPRL